MYVAVYCLKALEFLEYIHYWIPKSGKNDDRWIESIRSHIEKWIGELIDNIDMSAHDAKDYVALMRSQNGLKVYRKLISGKVSK